MPGDDRPKHRCFLALPHSEEFAFVKRAVREAVANADYKPILMDDLPVSPSGTIQEAIIGELARTDCLIADVTDRNPNVFFELGLAQAMGKPLLIITNKRSLNSVPFDIREFQLLPYEQNANSLKDLSERIEASLREFRQSPGRSPVLRGITPFSPPFFIEWGSLERRELENLCRELLAQMGFRRLEWGKMTPEIDLVAELPRKDPDGFEFRELWLISMGFNAPLEMFLDMAMHEPEYVFHRLARYSEDFERSLKDQEIPVTLLLILTRELREQRELQRLTERFQSRKLRRGPFGISVRFRVWDQNYLTTLVHQFPQIGYKYFSDTGRIQSRTRKSYEDLYRENSDLVARQGKLIVDLEEERNKRVRAERDAVWKDISFSAAHKIGNPIFAIETDLNPLVRRVKEKRTSEAIEVIENIGSSVEKAKAFVEQFKSLAKAQEIKPDAVLLLPLLSDAVKGLPEQGILCAIECPSDLKVWFDSERLSECLDELIANAKHWFNKVPKKIEFKAISPAPEPLPTFLDSSKKFALLHVKDNGCGIPVANKQKIFEAFFTTFDHGTGLGLALIRRVIDGHGGGIIENGIPGKGADFELYLPLPEPRPSPRRAKARVKSKK